MSVAIKKIEGVESVNVSLNEGFADIKLKDGNKATVDQVREIIRKNGFTPKDSTLTAKGKVIERNGKPALEVNGPDVVLLLADHGDAKGETDQLAKLMGRQVVVSGVVRETKSKNEPETLEVQTVSTARG